jgi:nucleotide-binding universal stress UspA family protein
MFDKILVPLDGSAWAEEALSYAIWLTQESGGQLILVQVVPSAVIPPAKYGIAEAEPWLIRQSQEKQEAEQYLAEVVQRPELRRLRPRHLVVEGPTAETLVRTIEQLEADAVVIATRGRRGLVRWVLGSVADHVVKHASVPVLLVRAAENPETETFA